MHLRPVQVLCGSAGSGPVRTWRVLGTGVRRTTLPSPPQGLPLILCLPLLYSTLNLPSASQRDEEIGKMGEERGDDDQDGERWRQRERGKEIS